jgi:hypothetical protein
VVRCAFAGRVLNTIVASATANTTATRHNTARVVTREDLLEPVTSSS